MMRKLPTATAKTATPFELKWGLRRGGWGKADFPLLCEYCGATLGQITVSDWMYSTRVQHGYRDDKSGVATPHGTIHALLRDHLVDLATSVACLAPRYAANNHFHSWLAQNPNSNPAWLREMAKHPYEHNDNYLRKNPILPMLLLEDPAHAEWIKPLMERTRDRAACL